MSTVHIPGTSRRACSEDPGPEDADANRKSSARHRHTSDTCAEKERAAMLGGRRLAAASRHCFMGRKRSPTASKSALALPGPASHRTARLSSRLSWETRKCTKVASYF